MPHIGSEAVDEEGVALIARWIASLPRDPGATSSQRPDLTSTSGALAQLLELDALSSEKRKEAIAAALAKPPGLIRDLFERFEPPAQRRERLGTNIRPERILALKGDAGRGRELFQLPTLQCSKCHRVQEGKETLGPDLSKIGAKYTCIQLLESILDPSKTIDPKYVASILQTKSGDVLSGIVVSQTEEDLVLRDADKETKLALKDVERRVAQQKSLMPEALLQHLTAQEAADLVAYLESLR
jgi:putative heme-binding domain-containing protein